MRLSTKAEAWHASRVLAQLIFLNGHLPARFFSSATAAGDSIQKEADRVGLTLDATTSASTDLDGMIAYAIRLMTGEIVRVILERLGRIKDFIPLSSGNRLPNDAPALMAYGGLVTLALYAQVKREGCSVPLNIVMKGLGEAIFFACG
jgi:hypothetical protein